MAHTRRNRASRKCTKAYPGCGLSRQRLQVSNYKPTWFKGLKETMSKELKEGMTKMSDQRTSI